MGPKKEKAIIPEPEEPVPPEPEIEEKIERNIKIFMQKVENIDPIFTATDIYIEVKHADNIIGQSIRVPVYDKLKVCIDYETQFTCNIINEKSLDNLLSCPLYFTVWQVPGEADINLYPSRSETSEDTSTHVITKESITSLYEAILGVKWEEELEEEEEQPKVKIIADAKKDKEQKGDGDKLNKKQSKEIKSEENLFDPNTAEPVCVGSCNLDLLPFFLGKKVITETLTLQQENIHLDDEMVTLPNLPLLSVSLAIDQRIFEEEYRQDDRTLNNLFNLTIESIYNIPEYFCENIEYRIATPLPTEKLTFKQMCYTGAYKQGVTASREYKLWPNLTTIKNFSAHTHEMIEEDMTHIKNKIGVHINQLALKSEPRITWNILIKSWLTTNAKDFLQKNIIRYRQWPIEIFLINKEASAASKHSKIQEESVKKCVFNPQFQHLMGFVDISSILYPGVTKTRVACALRTFKQQEFTAATGFDSSYFVSKCPVSPRNGTPTDKKDKKGGKDSKKDKERRDSEFAEKDIDPTLESSQPVLNENGEPTFIILEFELMFPFQPRRSLPDLTTELLIGIPNRSGINSSVLNVRFATQYYRETIVKLACEINIQYQKYKNVHNNNKDHMQFIKYLQENGMYQMYYTTVSRAVIIMVREKFSYTSDFKNSYAFANYASNVYTYMQNILNTQIHELMSCNMLMCLQNNTELHDDLFYATEAFEIGAISLANRYHLQGLNKEINKPNKWFHLAVFYFKTNEDDKAFECLKEGLALKVDHKYNLLLFGIILCKKKDYYLSETTFLTLVSYHPKFIAGWVCLYSFYQKRQQFEGCDFCLEKITEFYYKNKQSIQDDEEDEIRDTDGLSWTTNICNSDNFFYVTSLLLIKIGAFDFADMTLSTNNFTQDGVYRYYQAVILYYAKDYEQALLNLSDAQKLHGPDYAVNSLIGHCHYHLGNYTEAKEAYEFIVEAFNRPDDMHILYMNLSFIYESEKNYELARKYMIYVCKYSPTPYSWLLLGILYYKDNNYVNAEPCLEEANLLDTRLPEPWAYLVLINFKFGKYWEAQQCYTQMLRFQLKNKELLEEVENEMRAHRFLDKLN